MSIRNLDRLFRPRSIAVFGASNRTESMGWVIMRNLLMGGFSGPIMPINAESEAVAGVLTYRDVASLPVVPDLAVICTPPHTVPKLIGALGERGTRAAMVLGTQGQGKNSGGGALAEEMMAQARKHDLRILGPNCMGLMVPKLGLNASFAHIAATPGKLAFVSQSGALCTTVLDWAHPKGIGFSHFVSLGDCTDLDFGDILDYLAGDSETRAILLYMESIRERRNFMSAARAAARNKPVLCIKAGRDVEGARAAASHSGAMAGSDDVYDAAIRRAGMLRVYDIDELFTAVETLARTKPMRGERLAILTNGGGPGVMAVDDLIDHGGVLAKLSDDTIRKLDSVLPSGWPRSNPIDILGDASAMRYADALKILHEDRNVDAILVMHAPAALSSSMDNARAVIETVRTRGSSNVLTCWLGQEAAAPARRAFAEAGIPTYNTPGRAIRAFLHLVNYNRNQVTLMEMPPSAPTEFTPATAAARTVIENVLAEGSDIMSEAAAKAVLAAYGVPVVETHVAASSGEAALLADKIGYPVALKILSRDIPHKSDVGGVALNLESAEAVRAAGDGILARVGDKMPRARVEGFTVQKMASRANARELIVGVATDPIFGPVILFGEGGTAVEVIKDSAIALPPLNMSLARELISRTRVSKLLKGYRDRPAADIDAICLTLIQISQLIIDMPEIVELDINPLFADNCGVLAVDARMKIAQAPILDHHRLAIRPYPKSLEEHTTLKSGGRVLLRPIRPEDEPAHHAFIARLSPEDIRFRFFGHLRVIEHAEMTRLTQIDYDREMAFIATIAGPDGRAETLGVVRTFTDSENQRAEFAIVIRSDIKGQGLGRELMQKMMRYCKARGTRAIVGQVLPENTEMIRFMTGLGFETRRVPDDDAVEAHRNLN